MSVRLEADSLSGPTGEAERGSHPGGEWARSLSTSCSRLLDSFLSVPASLQEYASKSPCIT
eukprot:scaffold6168_cov420-Prasinococcus_capsulatus_cf.AAC.8